MTEITFPTFLRSLYYEIWYAVLCLYLMDIIRFADNFNLNSTAYEDITVTITKKVAIFWDVLSTASVDRTYFGFLPFVFFSFWRPWLGFLKSVLKQWWFMVNAVLKSALVHPTHPNVNIEELDIQLVLICFSYNDTFSKRPAVMNISFILFTIKTTKLLLVVLCWLNFARLHMYFNDLNRV